MIAAAQVHTIKTYGPDWISAFSPIPAMSMVSHCVGTRFTQLIGGVMTSFYDWYADLPVASPQVFGDQTDVPESGDWWDATYLMMWGSNVPVTRTPDAHWMAEVRYRGTKIVTVSPDYADNTKFADEWLPAQAGTDAALAMAMTHVILKEFFVDRRVPFFTDFVKTYTDLPFLITLTDNAEHGGLVPGKFLTEVDLAAGADAEPEAAWKTVLLDAASGKPVVPNGSMGFRSPTRRRSLEPRSRRHDPGSLDPRCRRRRGRRGAAPLFEAADGSAGCWPTRAGSRVGVRLVTTVFDLISTSIGRPADLPGNWPTATTTRCRRTRRPGRQRSPACRRKPASGSPANSPPTPSSPTVGP